MKLAHHQHGADGEGDLWRERALERFQEKWKRFSGSETRHNKSLEQIRVSAETEFALGSKLNQGTDIRFIECLLNRDTVS
ncbi:MAG: hypothetical protein MI723_19170 [Caulobacterales bacterium]|nr:hypothetical protein [Caulobacterales bacterium]